MRKIMYFSLFLIAIISFACGSSDRFFDGEPKYDTDGKKVSGDNLTIDEYLTYKVITYTVKNLNRPEQEVEKKSPILINENGQLKGHIVNNSNRNLDVSIVNKNGKEIVSINLSRRTFVEIFLTPGKEYVVYKDYKKNSGGKFFIFDVMPDVRADYIIEYRNRETEMLRGHFYIDDKKF